MNNSLKIYLADDGFYDLEETDNVELLVLAFFLLNDAPEQEELFQDWLDSIDTEFESDTLTEISKTPDFVTISYSPEPDEDIEPFHVQLDHDNFAELLNLWQAAYENEEETILITKEDGQFLLS